MLHAAFLPFFILGAVVISAFTLAWAICAIGGMADDEQQLGEREVEEREARDVESGARGKNVGDAGGSDRLVSRLLHGTVPNLDQAPTPDAPSPALSCHAERVHRVQRPLLPARRGDR